MRENHHVPFSDAVFQVLAVDLANVCNHTVNALRHLLDALAAWASIIQSYESSSTSLSLCLAEVTIHN